MLEFNIKEVAEKVGVTPATLRNWEKNGLFIPKRSDNNYRTYSIDDIKLLKKIKYLSIEKKLNGFSIKKIISQKDYLEKNDVFKYPQNDAKPLSMDTIIQKWKNFRKSNKLTLEDISKDTGISVSYLSKIENSNANVSLEILNKLSSYSGESLLQYPKQTSSSSLLVKENERIPLNINLDGIYVESLINRPNTILRPTIFTVLPHSGQRAFHKHNGEEFIFILKGNISFKVGDDYYSLNTNESLSFDSNNFHSWFNDSDYIVQMLWIHSPFNYNEIL